MISQLVNLWININKSCIEILDSNQIIDIYVSININKSCIEIIKGKDEKYSLTKININKSCIEIAETMKEFEYK